MSTVCFHRLVVNEDNELPHYCWCVHYLHIGVKFIITPSENKEGFLNQDG